jgi:hypothetical protein
MEPISQGRRLNVLLLANDSLLLQTRAAVIRSTGARVTACRGEKFAAGAAGPEFAVAVLCHSIPRPERARYMKRIASLWPEIKLVQLDIFGPKEASLVENPVVISSEPEALVTCLKRVWETAQLPRKAAVD